MYPCMHWFISFQFVYMYVSVLLIVLCTRSVKRIFTLWFGPLLLYFVELYHWRIWTASCRNTWVEPGCVGGCPASVRSVPPDRWRCVRTPRTRTSSCASACRRSWTIDRALSFRDFQVNSAGWMPCRSGCICMAWLLKYRNMKIRIRRWNKDVQFIFLKQRKNVWILDINLFKLTSVSACVSF